MATGEIRSDDYPLVYLYGMVRAYIPVISAVKVSIDEREKVKRGKGGSIQPFELWL